MAGPGGGGEGPALPSAPALALLTPIDTIGAVVGKSLHENNHHEQQRDENY